MNMQDSRDERRLREYRMLANAQLEMIIRAMISYGELQQSNISEDVSLLNPVEASVRDYEE